MATYYVSSYYQVCQRHHPATPKLTEKQHAAFAEFDRLASSPELAMNWSAPFCGYPPCSLLSHSTPCQLGSHQGGPCLVQVIFLHCMHSNEVAWPIQVVHTRALLCHDNALIKMEGGGGVSLNSSGASFTHSLGDFTFLRQEHKDVSDIVSQIFM